MIPEYVSKAAIQIYSMDFGMKCTISERQGMEVTILISYGKCDMVRINDPVVFMYMNNDIFQCRSARVLSADYKNCSLRLLIAEDLEKEEKRVFERYPISLEASARKKFQNKRINLVAKNASLYGLGVISNFEIEIDEFLDLDLITKKNMFYFSAKIVWKKILEGSENNYEYGLHIKDIDVATINILDEYLKKLRVMYMDMYEKAR